MLDAIVQNFVAWGSMVPDILHRHPEFQSFSHGFHSSWLGVCWVQYT